MSLSLSTTTPLRTLTDVGVQELVDRQILGLESTVTRLESTISKFKSNILDLKARRNFSSAISKLPLEIMVEIFLEGKRRARDANLSGERTCLSISGVCRSWRSIALSAPRLWSSIDVTSVHVDGCFEMLRRSNSLPLHIRYAPKAYDLAVFQRYDRAVATIASQVGRIQTLEIIFASPEALFQFLSQSANVGSSLLQVFRSTVSRSLGSVLRTDVFGREMPSLRSLILYGGTIALPFPYLPSLTHLELVSSSSPFWDQRLSRLLQCLQNMPNIEVISIKGLHWDIVNQQPMFARIALPKLSSLNISSSHIDSLKIFAYLPRPTSTSIQLTCPPESFSNADVTSLKHAFDNFAAQGPMSISARVAVTNVMQLEVVLDISRPNAPLVERFSLKVPISESNTVETLLKLSAVLPLAEVSSLLLIGFTSDPEPEDGDEWLKWVFWLFQPFQNVKRLRFFRCATSVLLSGLLKCNEGFLPAPLLREIHFDDCSGSYGDDRWFCWADMNAVLSQRKDVGISVEVYWDGSCFTDLAEESPDSDSDVDSLDCDNGTDDYDAGSPKDGDDACEIGHY